MAKSRLRGSTLTWWKYLYEERKELDKRPIENWKTMTSKVKEQYLPNNYENQLHNKRKRLKEKGLDVETYTKEFQKLCLRYRLHEDKGIKMARYLGGLKWSIQEE